jgi:hypothetical protein
LVAPDCQRERIWAISYYLQSGGGFGLPVDIQPSFDRLVGGLVIALASWSDPTSPTGG